MNGLRHSRPAAPVPGRLVRVLMAMAAAAALGACADTPLQPEAAAPGGPSMLLNPLCTGGGGTVHSYGTITTTETWQASGNPHRVQGSQFIDAGGRLRIRPGVVVCFDPGTALYADNGGYVSVDGDDTLGIVLTADDPAVGWFGIQLQGTPAATSVIGHTRIELVHPYATAVTAYDSHPVVIGNTVIRQSGRAAHLHAPGSRIIDSRVDTTTYRYSPAVLLGDSTRFTRTTVQGAAGDGVMVLGQTGVELLGGRIQGSGGTGLYVIYEGAVAAAWPIRITGGSSYGAVLPADALARGYNSVAEMDSLLGNARDTLVVGSGTLHSAAYATAALPWRVDGTIRVDSGGSLRPQPGAKLFFSPYASVVVLGGGRLLARGTQAAPVLLTADDPAQGWGGISLSDTPSSVSFITNARLEHVNVSYTAVTTDASHAVVIDSTVIRRVGRAASLWSNGSRISHTRVDTTLSSFGAAVELSGTARLESTLIRGSSGDGLAVYSSSVQVGTCEIRESVGNGVAVGWGTSITVNDCNLVDNGGAGMYVLTANVSDGEDNWWGDAAGPTGPGGDGVSGPVDYTPWRTSPVVLPYVP